MDRVRQQPFGDGRRPHQFRGDRRWHALIGEAAGGILGRQQFADMAGRVPEGGGDRVPAIHDDRTVGIVAAQTVAAGALEPFAALDLFAGRAWFCARSRAAAGGTCCHKTDPLPCHKNGVRRLRGLPARSVP
jgi:hypothetical protein